MCLNLQSRIKDSRELHKGRSPGMLGVSPLGIQLTLTQHMLVRKYAAAGLGTSMKC